MKKILLSGAAFAVIGFAATAAAPAAHAADPVKLTVGGYVQEWFGYADNTKSSSLGFAGTGDAGVGVATDATNPDKVASHTDAEIKFDGSTKLDNGLEIGVEAAFNPSHASAQDSGNGSAASKRVFATVTGAFGEIVAGQAENVATLAHNNAPDEGNMYTSDGFWMEWVEAPKNNNEYWQQTTVQTNQPADKIAYTTPSFAGFQGAIDFTPDIDIGNYGAFLTQSQTVALGGNNIGTGYATHYALTYGGTFGGVTLKSDLGGMTQQYAGVQAYDAGVSVGFAGFTIGGSYLLRDTASGTDKTDNNPVRATAFSKKAEGQYGQSYDFGVGYENGPWGVSASYFHGEATDLVQNSGNGKDSEDLYMAGLGYTLGPGIKLTESVFTAKYKTQDGLAGLAHSQDQNQGWAAVSGLNITF